MEFALHLKIGLLYQTWGTGIGWPYEKQKGYRAYPG